MVSRDRSSAKIFVNLQIRYMIQKAHTTGEDVDGRVCHFWPCRLAELFLGFDSVQEHCAPCKMNASDVRPSEYTSHHSLPDKYMISWEPLSTQQSMAEALCFQSHPLSVGGDEVIKPLA